MQPEVILCFTPKAIFLGSFAARATPSSHVFSEFTRLGFLFENYNTLKCALAPVIHILFHQSLKNNHIVFFQNPDDLKLFVTHRIVPLDRACRRIGSDVDTKRFVPGSPHKARSTQAHRPNGDPVRPGIS